MLLEMGVRVWQPLATPVADAPATVDASARSVTHPPEAGATAPRVAGPRPTARELPLRVEPGLDAASGVALDVQALDGPALVQTAAQCQACGLCAGRKNTTLAMPDPVVQADWLVVGDRPDED